MSMKFGDVVEPTDLSNLEGETYVFVGIEGDGEWKTCHVLRIVQEDDGTWHPDGCFAESCFEMGIQPKKSADGSYWNVAAEAYEWCNQLEDDEDDDLV